MLVSDVQLQELIAYYSHQLSTLKDIGVDVEDPDVYKQVQLTLLVLVDYKELRKKLSTPTSYNIRYTTQGYK